MQRRETLASLTLISHSITPSFAAVTAASTDVDAVEAELDSEGYAKIDDRRFCTVAMITPVNRVIRRYHGQRNWRSNRCDRPMRQCQYDLRLRRYIGFYCAEVRW